MSDMEVSVQFWDAWNARFRSPERLEEISFDQRRAVLDWLRSRGVRGARILEVGCGTGWLCDAMLEFGEVTGVDLSKNCLEAARRRTPEAEFVAGDFMELDFRQAPFDVVVSLEVLAHVEDQQAFVDKIASLLKPGGLLMLATQNKPMLQRWAKVDPVAPGQRRRWLSQPEIRAVLAPHFDVAEMFTVTPRAHRWPLRLLTAKKVRALVPGFTRWQERRGWGWSIMVLAQKRA